MRVISVQIRQGRVFASNRDHLYRVARSRHVLLPRNRNNLNKCPGGGNFREGGPKNELKIGSVSNVYQYVLYDLH